MYLSPHQRVDALPSLWIVEGKWVVRYVRKVLGVIGVIGFLGNYRGYSSFRVIRVMRICLPAYDTRMSKHCEFSTAQSLRERRERVRDES